MQSDFEHALGTQRHKVQRTQMVFATKLLRRQWVPDNCLLTVGFVSFATAGSDGRLSRSFQLCRSLEWDDYVVLCALRNDLF